MATTVLTKDRGITSVRDVRAAMLDAAAHLALLGPALRVCLVLTSRELSEETIRAEWNRMLPALETGIRLRLTLEVVAPDETPARGKRIPLDSINSVHEVLRLLARAALHDDGHTPVTRLAEQSGLSRPTIYGVLKTLREAGLLHDGRGPQLDLGALSPELLATVRGRAGALRFTFARGACPMDPSTLVARAGELLHANRRGWGSVALSGFAAAMLDFPALDLVGMPRLDLAVQVPRGTRELTPAFIHALHPDLELEPRINEPAAVVVHVLRGEPLFRTRTDGIALAQVGDVLLSIFESSAVRYAHDYIKYCRPARK
ncbi:helix-turn-helix domain-containing protein [Luteimonas pelagia]